MEFDKWKAAVQEELSRLTPDDQLKMAFENGIKVGIASVDTMLPQLFEFGSTFNLGIGAVDGGFVGVSRNFKISGPSALGCVLQLAAAEAKRLEAPAVEKPSLILPTK